MKKASVIGHYACGLEYLDGQTIKTKIITDELCRKYGKTEILQIDTHGRLKTLLKAPIYTWRAIKNSKNVIILPAQNGLRIFGRLLPLYKRFFKNRKIHYVVIGGWLLSLLEKKRGLARALKKFDGIYVETNTMKESLEAKGFKNIFVMQNCKELTPLMENDLVYQNETPYRLCTFSRVMKEKGIEDAIEVVKAINAEYGKIVYTLDIYGQVDSLQEKWFNEIKSTFPQYVKYKGRIPFDKSVEVLKCYFALLFPTKFFTEGIPGTIIDAYAAGIPVISSKWQSFNDIIDDGTTGKGYEFNSFEDLKKVLVEACNSVSDFNKMKVSCLKKSKNYSPSEVIEIITRHLA